MHHPLFCKRFRTNRRASQHNRHVSFRSIVYGVSYGYFHIFLLILNTLLFRSRTISRGYEFITKLKQTSVADGNRLIHTVSSNEFSELTKEYNHMSCAFRESGKEITCGTTDSSKKRRAEKTRFEHRSAHIFFTNTLDCISSTASLGKTAQILNIVFQNWLISCE